MHFLKEIYTFTIHRREGKHEGKLKRTIIKVYNKNLPPAPNRVPCIECELYDYKPYLIYIAYLSRCGLNGTKHLERLIAFSKACGLSEISLDDESSVNYDTTDDATSSDHGIDLQKQSRLMTGKSWYERFGFMNKATKQHHLAIDDYINKAIGIAAPTLLAKLQHYVPEITDTTSVKDAVSFVYRDLNELCPKRKCPYEDNLDDVDNINDIIGSLYEEMLTYIGAKEDDFKHLSLILQ